MRNGTKNSPAVFQELSPYQFSLFVGTTLGGAVVGNKFGAVTSHGTFEVVGLEEGLLVWEEPPVGHIFTTVEITFNSIFSNFTYSSLVRNGSYW